MQDVKALFFDVGGTVFDWKNTAIENILKLAEDNGEEIASHCFANDWRGEMFNIHSQVRQGNLPWMNADEMHLRALRNITKTYPLLKKIDMHKLVADTWHNLKAFDGARESINRLRTKYTAVVLTVLSWESIVNSSKREQVQWDGILSCEFLGYYKPSLEAYRKAASLLCLKPEETMMVAAHKGDLAAAQATGMHTAHVKVPEEDNMANFGSADNICFDIEVDGFDELCAKLKV